MQFVHDGTLTNCEASGSNWDSGMEVNGGGIDTGSYNVSFVNCIAHDNNESGIEVDAGAQNITITNSLSYNNGLHGVEIEHHYVGIDLIAETKNVTLTGGELYNNHEEDLFVKGRYVTVDGVHCHNNTNNGVVCRQHGDYATIIDTECDHNGQYGLLVSGAIGCTQSNNNVHDNTLGQIEGF